MSEIKLSDNINEYGILILSKRDAIEFDYLLRLKGSDCIKYAAMSIKGARLTYVSNLAKALKVDIPKNLPDRSEVLPIDKGIEMLKSVMRLR